MKSKQVFNNAKWIILCRIVQSLMQLVVGMLCARYLGPSNYGLINYASSVVAFAIPIMKLGLDSTLVSELLNDPESEGEIMGTSLMMNVFSSLLCMGGVTAFATVANSGNRTVIIVCVLYSISIFSAALEMMQYWFQYKLISKYPAVTMLAAYLLVSAFRIYLLASSKSVYWFALTNAVDYGIIGISLIVLYLKLGTKRLSFSFSRCKAMFSRSKYYIFASLMIVVLHNTDHIMLTNMVSEVENGFYSAAITCATLAQFVYTAIIDSFRPMILSKKRNNELEYEKSVSRLYSVIIYLSLLQIVLFILLADIIVRVLYGTAYAPAASVLRILMCYTVFSVMGTVRNVWILAEQKQHYLPWINLCGAALNVVLNLCLIPVWKACGAALASLITQFVMNFVLGFIIKPIRKNNKLLLCGLSPKQFTHELRSIFSELKDS